MLYKPLFNTFLKYETYCKALNYHFFSSVTESIYTNGQHFIPNSNVLTSVAKIFQSHSMANYTCCSSVKGNNFKDPSSDCVLSGSSECHQKRSTLLFQTSYSRDWKIEQKEKPCSLHTTRLFLGDKQGKTAAAWLCSL